MKVMHITYDMRIGGTEMVIKNIIEGDTAADIEMSIFCIEAPLGPWGEELRESGVPIAIHERKPGFDLSLIKALRHHIKANNIDVVHCHQYTPWVYGAMAAAFTKAKVIFTEHGRFYPDSSSWKRRFVNPLLLKFTDHITAISKATKQALVEYEYIPEARIEVIYNGIKPLETEPAVCTRLKQEYELEGKSIIFGTVARLDPIKNQHMMIRAFAEVLKTEPKAALLVVGNGDEWDALNTLVDELDIRESLYFTGYVKHPVNHIGLMDVFLLSSLSEGTSMTLLEAMSLGKPCVVTDAGGNPEIIQHNFSGFVVENNHMVSFAQALSLIAKDAKLRLTYGRNGKSLFEEKFVTPIMLRTYSKMYLS